MSKVLFPDQVEAVEDLRAAFGLYDRVCFTLPTGGGKTVIFSYIAQQTEVNGKNVLIIAHRDFLLEQISKALADNGVEHKLICQPQLRSILYLEHLKEFGKVYLNKNSHVTVASIQTLARRDYKKILEEFDLIIGDEFHRACSPTYVKVFEAKKPSAKILGVTATPERTDGQGLKLVADKLVVGKSVAELIKLQRICYPVVYAPKTKLDLSGIKTVAGDYDNQQLFERMSSNKKLVGDAISHYKNISGIVPAMGFCVNVKHAEITAEEFRLAGIRAIALSAKHTSKERNDATYKLKNGELDIIFSCDLFNEGYDVGSVAAGIMLRPTQSTIIYRQQIGRILRRYPDSFTNDKFIKPNGDHIAYIFDHAGNTLRHGLPTDDKEWTLEGKKRKKKDEQEAKVSQCPMCYTYHATGLKICPNCGHKYFEFQREAEIIETEQGDLQAVNEYKPDWSKGIDVKNSPLNTVLFYAKTKEQLEEVAKAKGYKSSWVHYVLKARERKR